jgi:predicted TIM-barrel fold metal-dependent hydrolase
MEGRAVTKYSIISADSHVIEPPNLWLDYIEPAFRSRAPHVEREGEFDVFKCEGVTLIPVGALSGAGRPIGKLKAQGTYAADVPPGAWDPRPRVEEIAVDGVQAEVLYPSIALRMFAIPDKDYQLACFRAYNNWLADFAKVYPDRFKGIGVIPIDNIEAAVSELLRCKELGLSGVSISVIPSEEQQYDRPTFEPLWAAAQDTQMPVSLHILTERKFKPKTGFDNLVDNVVAPAAIQEALTRMIFSGVFDRFPSLKVVSAENDVGWAAYFSERLDYLFDKRRAFQQFVIPTHTPPSQYIRRGCYFTFMRDRSGILVRHAIGLDNILWSSDYPHQDSTWPNSQKVIEYLCGDIPAGERHQIVAGNAARLYGFN